MVKGKVHTTCDEDLSECQPRESECPGHVRVLCILIHTMWQQFSATCQWMPTCTTWHEVPTVCHSIVMPTTWQPFSQRVSGCQEETLPRGISDVYHMTMIAHHVSVAVYHMTGRYTTTWHKWHLPGELSLLLDDLDHALLHGHDGFELGETETLAVGDVVHPALALAVLAVNTCT